MVSANEKDFRRKIKSVEELCAIIGPRPREKKVIMCHGTFDIVRPGHIRHLLYSREKADILVASLTCDAHIAKADFRPFVPEELRAVNLAALEVVDHVIIDHEPTPLKNLQTIQPDYFAKGYEYIDGAVHPRTQEEIEVLEGYGGEVIFTPGDVVYSSSKLIEEAPPKIAADKLVMLMEAEGISFEMLADALAGARATRVLVLGDTIVDSYTRCNVIGGVTKTPTISVRYEEREDFSGGAAIVAKHLKAAGAKVSLSTVLGDDALKDYVLQDLEQAGVECRPVIDPSRPTTNKNVIVAGGYHMLKVDTVDNRAMSQKILGELAESVSISTADAVVFSDFRHGIFNSSSIPRLIDAIPEGRFRVADSQVASRWGNILDFQNFDLITPNEREARFALADQDIGVRPLAQELYSRANCKHLVLKLGSRGLITYRPRSSEDVRAFFVLDSFTDNVVDAVGAGDALLAYTTLVMAAQGSDVVAAILGAFAAAVECEYEGNVPVDSNHVLAKLRNVERRAKYE